MKVTDEMLYKYVPLAAEELLREYTETTELPFQPSESFEKKMKKLIRQSRHPKMHFRFMSAAGRVAAIIVICVALLAATTFSMKAADVLRIRLREQIQHDGYVEERYSMTGEGQLRYFTYVPVGYEQEYFEEDEFGYVQKFVDTDGDKILIRTVLILDSTVVVTDSEYVECYEKTIESQKCTVGTKEDGSTNYVWIRDGTRYEVSGNNLSEDEIGNMIVGLK